MTSLAISIRETDGYLSCAYFERKVFSPLDVLSIAVSSVDCLCARKCSFSWFHFYFLELLSKPSMCPNSSHRLFTSSRRRSNFYNKEVIFPFPASRCVRTEFITSSHCLFHKYVVISLSSEQFRSLRRCWPKIEVWTPGSLWVASAAFSYNNRYFRLRVAICRKVHESLLTDIYWLKCVKSFRDFHIFRQFFSICSM